MRFLFLAFFIFVHGSMLWAGAEELVSYDFTDSPTESKLDAEIVAPGLAASELTEHGNPDGEGAGLDFFMGASLNIKRAELDRDPDNFSDYIEWSIASETGDQQIKPAELELRFNQFKPRFAAHIFVRRDDEEFQSAAIVGDLKSENTELENSHQNIELPSLSPARRWTFRIEFAHDTPSGAGNTTLQLSRIIVRGQISNKE